MFKNCVFKVSVNTQKWLKSAAVRAIKTVAQTAVVQRIPDAHCNGDMHAALEYARKVKHQHKDFLYEKAVDSIVE